MKTMSLLAGACLVLGMSAPCARANPALPMNLADFLVPAAAAVPLCGPTGELRLAEPFPFAADDDGLGCPQPFRPSGSHGAR